MNATKLGLRITSSVLATALCLAPVNGALAAPPDGDADAPAEGDAPEGDAPEGETPEGVEGEGGEGETPEGVEGEGAEGEGAEGETPEGETPEGVEGEGAEGEGAEGEGAEGEGEGDLPEAEEVEAEAEAEAEAEVAPPDLTLDADLRPPEPTWGPKDQYSMDGKGMLITGGIVTGLGAAFIVTSILITDCNFDSSLSCKFGDQRDFLIPSAVAATGLGLLLIGVGVGNRVKHKRWENWKPEQTAVVPTTVPGGGGLAWVGRF